MKAIQIIAILAILLLAGCAKQAETTQTPTGSQTPTTNEPQTPTGSAETPQVAAPQTPVETPAGPEEMVILTDTTSDPVDVKVSVGGSVTFKNTAEKRPHMIIVDELGLKSSRLEAGQTFTFKFDNAGTYNYRDIWVGSLRGTITVE